MNGDGKGERGNEVKINSLKEERIRGASFGRMGRRWEVVREERKERMKEGLEDDALMTVKEQWEEE